MGVGSERMGNERTKQACRRRGREVRMGRAKASGRREKKDTRVLCGGSGGGGSGGGGGQEPELNWSLQYLPWLCLEWIVENNGLKKACGVGQ
ncbi:hypothetical protein CC1G_15775 [Coprinopsis cinerea okayama7|uniref:Uncharacterized protein n=1 Tax=Coprinopsis cinerea (strain Okayama-7 / 130 / ATCC MYA-4618 / FGSC 9003) TaxID=240176 RepID=D6RR18_COPC7|nr:hypothetical protein CC1G_15775 [Coprinopsis cinerea okayama7\|eukprot:XP_002910055.1 hypothetical protein CC1G_15775 [Coprinopsis cinerea okayama7\